jgi:murein DD-endopeptidase MepM/ murein hydrolase activator NlpD
VRVSSPFGWRHRVGPHAPVGFHNGIDLPAPAGALVHAAAAGTVEVVKRQGSGGVTVHLRHPGGLVTLYAHLGNLAPAIAQGKRNVAAGEMLGHVARTGVTYGTHVFLAVLKNGQAWRATTTAAVLKPHIQKSQGGGEPVGLGLDWRRPAVCYIGWTRLIISLIWLTAVSARCSCS